jgi:environmental stress-induced protein Ves
MPLQIIRFASLEAKPWKNGGGETMELAACPEGAEFDTFDWRVSLARVASDGPFSAFPGIARTLTLMAGDGLALRVGTAPETILTPSSEPFSFSGDAATSARLLGGPILDLNVMTRRGRARHRVSLLDVGADAVRYRPEPGFLVVRDGHVEVDGVWLAPFDAVRIGPEESAPLTLVAKDTARLVAVALMPSNDPDRDLA